MTSPLESGQSEKSTEAELRAELVRGEAVRLTIPPMLAHLLGNGANSLYSDDILASIRGMTYDVSQQLLESGTAQASDAKNRLSGLLFKNAHFIGHLHALAIEWQLTQRLHSRLALDPVLPPLLQDLMASTNPERAGLAMHVLAAQTRYCQAQRRMKLPVSELPATLLPGVILDLSAALGGEGEGLVDAINPRLRSLCDESKSRTGLLSRLLMGMGGQISAALSVSNAGIALFTTALSLVLQQHRDSVILSLNGGQVARLALSLRAAGLKPQDAGAQIFSLHPDIPVPAGLEQISPDQAAEILSTATHRVGS
jgi:hypothetical protein